MQQHRSAVLSRVQRLLLQPKRYTYMQGVSSPQPGKSVVKYLPAERYSCMHAVHNEYTHRVVAATRILL
jgi:hypothetical protein